MTRTQEIQAANIAGIGFGGNCGAAALAINKAIFDNAGTLVGAFNKASLAAGRPIGHIAVRFKGKYYDADGKPKRWLEIECWGMLDENDRECVEWAKKAKLPWNDITASEVTKMELTPHWIATHFDTRSEPNIRRALYEAA